MLLTCLSLLGCHKEKPKLWDSDKLVRFVQVDHDENFAVHLSQWDAWKIVLAARTLAPKDKVRLVLACGAAETHFSIGQLGDDGKSLGIYQVQWKYHRKVPRFMLQWDTTTNTREAVKHLRCSDWSPRIYNAGRKGAKAGRGRNHARKVAETMRRMEQF